MMEGGVGGDEMARRGYWITIVTPHGGLKHGV
jgi:hypothetical protein